LARALAALAPDFAVMGYTVHRTGRPTFDFDRPDSIDACFAATAPELVVNAAGWTMVDAAEAQPEAAARANDHGPTRLGALCAAAGIPYIHVSTDYVFDGGKGGPYVETDRPNPLGVYGATKLAGENSILAQAGRAVILRTSWIYAADGRNFVRAMLAAAEKNDTLRVVADQRGCPTSAEDLARAILAIATRIAAGWRDRYAGIFHAAGTGDTSWHGFAEAIFAAASSHGRSMPNLIPISTADWPTAARRPPDSRLDCGKLAKIFGAHLPEWRSSLDRVVAEICRHG
jgi:dTDP-4-dehydrorhamnose reductase